MPVRVDTGRSGALKCERLMGAFAYARLAPGEGE